MNNGRSLPRAARPEDAGVSSRVVGAFLEAIEREGLNLHSFMVLRHGAVAAECYRAPFTADTPHAMYSASKTFTAAALGIAVGEGLVSLSDRVRDFFPEYTAELRDEKLDCMTLRHLVCMQAGKNPGIFADKTKPSWVRDFFRARWSEAPGEKYRYISENTYMIAAVLRKVTGVSMREYLRPRLFEPLGIETPFWETDRTGVEAGGWGLYAKTEDLAKLMQLYLQDGEWNGRQIIPADYVHESRALQSDNSCNTAPDCNAGYGYGLWLCGQVRAYRADGMFSQFGIVFPEEDAVLVTTCGCPLEQEFLTFAWQFFPAAFHDETPADAAESDAAVQKLRDAVLDRPFGFSWSLLQDSVNGRSIRFRKNLLLNAVGFPMSMLPLAVTFMLPEKCGNITDMKLRFEEGSVLVTWREGREINTVRAGMDGRFCYGVMTLGGIEYKVCATAEWRDNRRLHLELRPIETVGKRMLELTFRPHARVVMKPSSTPSIREITKFIQDTANDTYPFVPLQKAIAAAMKILPPIVEPRHYGRIR